MLNTQPALEFVINGKAVQPGQTITDVKGKLYQFRYVDEDGRTITCVNNGKNFELNGLSALYFKGALVARSE